MGRRGSSVSVSSSDSGSGSGRQRSAESDGRQKRGRGHSSGLDAQEQHAMATALLQLVARQRGGGGGFGGGGSGRPGSSGCHNCGSRDHTVRTCPSPLFCTFCFKQGHTKNVCGRHKATVCFNCGDYEHILRECPMPMYCNKCRVEGHTTNRCPRLSSPARNRFVQRITGLARQMNDAHKQRVDVAVIVADLVKEEEARQAGSRSRSRSGSGSGSWSRSPSPRRLRSRSRHSSSNSPSRTPRRGSISDSGSRSPRRLRSRSHASSASPRSEETGWADVNEMLFDVAKRPHKRRRQRAPSDTDDLSSFAGQIITQSDPSVRSVSRDRARTTPAQPEVCKLREGTLLGTSGYAVKSVSDPGTKYVEVLASRPTSGRNSAEEEALVRIVHNCDQLVSEAQRELALLQSLHKDAGVNRCVSVGPSFSHGDHWCLPFEALDISLHDVMESTGLHLQAVMAFGNDLVRTLMHVHSCGVVHGAISPRALRLTRDRSMVKLTDFERASRVAQALEPADQHNLLPYSPPEHILGHLAADPSADMWAVPCTIYELYTGRQLFDVRTPSELLTLHHDLLGPYPDTVLDLGKNSMKEKHFLPDGNPRVQPVLMPLPEILESLLCLRQLEPGPKQRKVSQLVELLSVLLELDPSYRPTAAAIARHPFWGAPI